MEILDFEGLRIGVESKRVFAYGDVHRLRADGRAYLRQMAVAKREEVGRSGSSAVPLVQTTGPNPNVISRCQPSQPLMLQARLYFSVIR